VTLLNYRLLGPEWWSQQKHRPIEIDIVNNLHCETTNIERICRIQKVYCYYSKYFLGYSFISCLFNNRFLLSYVLGVCKKVKKNVGIKRASLNQSIHPMINQSINQSITRFYLFWYTFFTLWSIKSSRTIAIVAVEQVNASAVVQARICCTFIYFWDINVLESVVFSSIAALTQLFFTMPIKVGIFTTCCVICMLIAGGRRLYYKRTNKKLLFMRTRANTPDDARVSVPLIHTGFPCLCLGILGAIHTSR